MEVWQKAAGGKRPDFGNATYLSEKDTCDRNYAIAYLMVSFHNFSICFLFFQYFFLILKFRKQNMSSSLIQILKK